MSKMMQRVVNPEVAQAFREWRFYDAYASAMAANEDSSIIDLACALKAIFGEDVQPFGGTLGEVINHALQRAGVDRQEFERIDDSDCVAGALYNDKYLRAEELLPYGTCVAGKQMLFAPEVRDLILSLSAMLGNPGWYGGSIETVKRWAVGNIIASEAQH